MKKISMLLLAGAAVSVLSSTNLIAEDKLVVILGTATPGGGFPVYGAAFAETINRFDPSLEVKPRNTKGSIENVPLLEAEKLDIALVQGEVVHDVFSSTNRASVKLKIITAMYSTPGMFVVRADSPYHSITDLIGKPVVFGVRVSGLVILARYVLDAIGLDQDRDFKAIYLTAAGDGPAMVNDGRAAALWGGGPGWPGFAAVAKSPSGARFVAPTTDEIKSILAKCSFLRRLTVPAGSYPGQSSPISSVGSWSFVLARSTLSDDVAYRLARALHRGESTLGARLVQARETTAENTIAAAPHMSLIHPGVLRFFREIKLLR
ncbi:MAG TPA: TAXI family TRAP transporter solute-binding subunit [Nitrospirota bacterium]|nr:TAXI family TRAP transporter solute-binding subunit [Nitrospirota bacterium]